VSTGINGTAYIILYFSVFSVPGVVYLIIFYTKHKGGQDARTTRLRMLKAVDINLH
jgi:hypothetical protein